MSTNRNIIEVVSAEGAAEILGIHVEKFRSLPSEKIPLVYARTVKQTKELGLPPTDSPDNTELFLLEDVLKLKQELEE